MIRASASYTSGWGSFVLLKMDRVRVARGGSLSTLHRCFHTVSSTTTNIATMRGSCLEGNKTRQKDEVMEAMLNIEI